MQFRRISALADINVKNKDNSLWLHPTWHFISRMWFSLILVVRSACIDKLDYLFREWLATGVTAVTI